MVQMVIHHYKFSVLGPYRSTSDVPEVTENELEKEMYKILHWVYSVFLYYFRPSLVYKVFDLLKTVDS